MGGLWVAWDSLNTQYTIHKSKHSPRQANEASLSHQHTRIVLTEAKDQLRK